MPGPAANGGQRIQGADGPDRAARHIAMPLKLAR